MSGPTRVRVYVASNVRMTRPHVFPGFKRLMKDEISSELFRDFESPQSPREDTGFLDFHTIPARDQRINGGGANVFWVDKMGVDKMGVDKMGVDQMGVDEMRTHRT